MYLDRVRADLAAIRSEGRYREIESRQPSLVIDFSSNDYLGLATDKTVVQALRNAHRVGSGGARLLGGRNREHSLLEEELAAWLGRERALLFSSGYLAAAGTVAVLSSYVDRLYSDRLNHASLIDGIRLSKKPKTVYEHLQLPGERTGSGLLISETLFGMDGDSADVAATLASAGADDVVLFDEAHALGVTGPEGAGLAAGFSDERVVVLGTLSKAFGALGGFVAGPAAVVDLLVNGARTFIFDTALPPAIALAARVALVRLRRDEERRMALRANASRLGEGLRAMGFPAPAGFSPVVPIVIGDPWKAMDVSRRLLERGIYVPAIRPPTVPPHTSRLRVSLRADHTIEHVDMLLSELQRCIASS